MSMSTGSPSLVELQSFSVPQLSHLKKYRDDELEHLSASFSQLRDAQAKFRDCSRSVQAGITPLVQEKPILLALTSSLYVPGKLADPDHVIVDVGTGYYVEKTTKDAIKFYETRVEELGSNLKLLEGILQEKSNYLQALEEILRHKLLETESTTIEN